MIQKRLFDEGWLRNENSIMHKTKPDRFLKPVRFGGLLLFLLMTLATSNAIAALILSTPGHLSEGYPYSEMGLWWKYDEDPEIAAEIEEQVDWIGLRLYETDDPTVYKTPKFSDYVGRCRLYEICTWCSLQYETKFRYSRTFASTAECGEELKPDQWYKWSVWVEKNDGSFLAKAGAFKTGNYRDIIIDETSAGFTQGGPGPFHERGRGYNNSSFLVNTTWEENENNYCQWEWTIPEERDYEVSVYMPLKFFSNSRMGSSEQARYELWREGLETRSKTIVQNWDYRNLWMTLGTHHFKAGPAKLRLSDNTGESTPLGRKIVCDAVRVRKRFGAPNLSPHLITSSSQRRSTRAIEPVFYPHPQHREVVLRTSNSQEKILFEWPGGGNRYRIQISPFKHFDDPLIIKWIISVFKNWWWDATNNTEETVENGQECGLLCINEITDVPLFREESNTFWSNIPYYWRVRIENETDDKPQEQWHSFSPWSQVRQFTVLDDPAEPGPYPVGRATWDDKNGINNIPQDSDELIAPSQKISLAWAQIMYPATQEGQEDNLVPVAENGKPYPVVIFIHGMHESCDEDGEGPMPIPRLWYQKPSWWEFLSDGICADDNRVPNHKGYNYILERLASHGIVAISISGNEIEGLLNETQTPWDLWGRGQLILSVLDQISKWNQGQSGQASSHPIGQLLFGKLDMENIGLSGHSRGGESVVAALQLNKKRSLAERHHLKAINAIAPTNINVVYPSSQPPYHRSPYLMADMPYFLLVGARDNDVSDMDGFMTYDRFYRDYTNLTGIGGHPKMVAFVDGANHNYFNTVWTDSDALSDAEPNEDLGLGVDNAGLPQKVNNWSGATDDARSLTVSFKMSAKEQRKIAVRTLVAFFRWHLKGDTVFKNIFTGNYKHENIHWTYQDAARLAVDNFEQAPDANTLGKENKFIFNFQGSSSIEQPVDEHLLNRGYSNTTISPADDADWRFVHDTHGIVLGFTMPTNDATADYRVLMPVQDVSSFSHLAFRIAHVPMEGMIPQQGLKVSLMSETEGIIQTSSLYTQIVSQIPYPYERTGGRCFIDTICDNQPVLSSVRIPLEEFDVDLTKISEIKITVPYSGRTEMAIDDIEFSH